MQGCVCLREKATSGSSGLPVTSLLPWAVLDGIALRPSNSPATRWVTPDSSPTTPLNRISPVKEAIYVSGGYKSIVSEKMNRFDRHCYCCRCCHCVDIAIINAHQVDADERVLRDEVGQFGLREFVVVPGEDRHGNDEQGSDGAHVRKQVHRKVQRRLQQVEAALGRQQQVQVGGQAAEL